MERETEDGYLIGPDGCHYENKLQVYHYAYLKLCGCGMPEEAYNFCREALQCFDRRDKSQWINAEAAVEMLILRDPKAAAHVLAHMLSNLDLLEHGGSVGGSWLAEKGEKIVDHRPAEENDEI